MLRNKLKRLVYSGPETRLIVTSDAKRRHLALRVANVEVINLVGAIAELRFRLQVDLPLPSKAIELVNISAAKECLQCLEHITELKPLLKTAILIDIHKQLRYRRAEGGYQ